MELIHWYGVAAIVVGTCHLLSASETNSLSETISQSGEVTMDQVYLMARSLKRKKYRSRKRPHSTRIKPRPPAYRDLEGTVTEEKISKDKGYGGSYGGSYGSYGVYSAPYYTAPTTYTQPIIYNTGSYGAGYYKPLIFLLIIPLVIIVVAAASVAVVNSSSSSAAAAAANQQQQQQQDSNNNNNNANNDNNNNNAAVAVVSSNTAATAPVIIIINATGRADDERLNFAKPTWLSQFFE